MKKLICLFLSMLVLATSVAVAQNSQSNYAGSSRFTDNWSVLFQGGVLTQFDNFYSGHTAMAPIVILGLNRDINPWLGVGVDGRTLIGTGSNDGLYETHQAFDYVNVNTNVRINMVNVFGYKGDRKSFEPIVYGGLGWGSTVCKEDRMDHNYFTTRAGVELNFNLGKKKAWAFVINPAVVWGDNHNKDVHEFHRLCKHNGNFELTTGFTYHFRNSNGTHAISRAVLYNYDEVASLNSTIKSLRKELAQTPKVIEVTNKVQDVVVQEVNDSYTVFFEQGDSSVGDLSAIAEALNAINGDITIIGGTSPEGPEDVNHELALARANAVKEALIRAGVKASRITVVDDYSMQRKATILVK